MGIGIINRTPCHSIPKYANQYHFSFQKPDHSNHYVQILKQTVVHNRLQFTNFALLARRTIEGALEGFGFLIIV